MARAGMKVKIVELDEVYNTISAAARAIHGDQGSITKVLKGQRKSHKGYTFKYVRK